MENVIDAPLSTAAQALVSQLASLRDDQRALANMSTEDLIRKYKIKNKDKFNASEKATAMQQDELRQMRAREDSLKTSLDKEMQKSFITKTVQCSFCMRTLTPSDERYTCSGCRKVVYCDETCAENDWNKHYRNCTFYLVSVFLMQSKS